MTTLATGADAAPINDSWQRAFSQRADLRAGHERLSYFRQLAIDKLATTAFPTRRDEEWRYSDFTKALRQDFQPILTTDELPERTNFEIPGLDAYVLVTVNGIYSAKLSDNIPNITVGAVEDYIEQEPYAFWLDRTVGGLTATATSAFELTSAAFAKGGLFIAGNRNARLDKSIHIIHLATRAPVPRLVNTQVFLMLPGGCELTINETFATTGTGEQLFKNHLIRGGVSSNAKLAFRTIQTEDEQDFYVSHAVIDQQADSTIDHVRVDFGGAQVRNTLNITHKGKATQTNMAGMYFAQRRQQIDNQTFLDHAYPHGESNEIYKGIVMDRGIGSFNGKVIVRPDAQKTNAFQQNDNLVIGKRAEANAKPQLEIYADDVKCSHGATIGQLDEAPLFYLQARGIPRGEALAMLHHGFLLEVLESIESEAVQTYVENLLTAKFNS